MAKKVIIELEPYNSIAILSFLREFINDETEGDYRFKAIHDAVDEYEQQIYKNVSEKQLEAS